MEPTPTDLVRHPPERGPSRVDAIAPAGCCCCCCCCCCLHTVGGLLGAVVGSTSSDDSRPALVRFRDEDDERFHDRGPGHEDGDRFQTTPNDRPRSRAEGPFPFRRDVFDDDTSIMPVALLYWLLVLFLGAVTTVITFIWSGARGPSMLVFGGLLAVMILPALQLVASVLTALAVLVFYPEKDRPLRRVGRITLWSFTGALLGLTVMGGCLGLLMLGR